MDSVTASNSPLHHSTPNSRCGKLEKTHSRRMMPKYSNLEIMEMKYSRFLRTVLLESIVKQEQKLVITICDDTDVVRTYKERMRQEHARTLMEVAKKKMMEKMKQIKSAENLIATYKALAHPGCNKRLEKLMNSLSAIMDILPVVSCNLRHQGEQGLDSVIEDFKNAVNSMIAAMKKNYPGTIHVRKNKISMAETLNKTKADELAMSKLNQLLVKLASMKEMVNKDYTQKLSNEKIPGSTFADIFGQMNYSSSEELNDSSRTLKFDDSPPASEAE